MNKQENYLIGRQPIFNRNDELVAYELLFRSAASPNKAEFSDVTHASASVIFNMISGFGLDHLIGKKKAFINLDLRMFMGEAIEILPKNRVVLEILESTGITPELISRCRELKESGFELALDDHSFNPLYEELYQIVDLIKIDLIQSPVETLDEMINRFRKYPLKLLAEKVETGEIYEKCHDLGFEYFQGYYFAKPTLMEKPRIDEPSRTHLKLVRTLLQDSEFK